MALIPLEEPRADAAKPGFALFALGFRPFYLLAALWAAVAVPLWLATFTARLAGPTHLPPLLWHAHEMVFGFAAAVIVGFLLTAARTWTGQPTSNGTPLALLACIWLAGRLTMGLAPTALAAGIDFVFLPLAAIALGRVLWRAKSQRNYFIVALLLALSCANGAFHLHTLGQLDGNPLVPLHLSIGLVVMLCTLIAGRIVPSFTANALRGIRQFQNDQLNYSAVGFTACALLAWIAHAASWAVASVAAIAAVLQAIRAWGWNPWATRKTPLLWILHLSHGWIPVGLILIAANALGAIPASPAWHALTIGAMGGLILGMITRTALGHTGRPLVAGRIETAAYLLLHACAVLRVVGVIVAPGAYIGLIELAMLGWSGAFLLYSVKYLPILLRARVDGKEG